MNEERADHIITALIDIIEREIKYQAAHAPQRAAWMAEALATVTENLVNLDD